MENKELIEGYDYVICKVCGEKVGRIYGRHLKHHNMTSQEYKNMYPDEPLTTKKDSKQTSKSSGLHMKQEKYRKMFSDKVKGDKNPNHKSKTTEKERKERSPFSKDFLYHNSESDRIEFIEHALSGRTFTTKIDYYLEQGYSEEDSEKMLKNRQSTFSKEICIKKYGKKEGLKIFTDRQEKWQKSLNENGNLKWGYSKISQELFYSLLLDYNINDRENIFFATKNNEIRLPKKNGGVWIYDFCDKKNNKIIEYNGDQYHANPAIYESNDTPHPFRKEVLAQEIWNKDKEKLRIAKSEGFEVLVIWDSDYKKNAEKVLLECTIFLNI
jgi:very-short-patch-repair endonuclease